MELFKKLFKKKKRTYLFAKIGMTNSRGEVYTEEILKKLAENDPDMFYENGRLVRAFYEKGIL